MDKMKRYIECYVPVKACTLRCHYCYITQHRLFDTELPKFKYSPEEVRKALSKKRLGGVCVINLCGGGETLLPPELPSYMRALLEEGHYITLVTNATVTKRLKEIAAFGHDLCKHIFIKFSFHYLEFKKRNFLDRFFENIKMMEEAGCSYTVEITPNDELIPYIPEVIALSKEKLGTLPHVTIARDETVKDIIILSKLDRDEYMKTWGVFDSNLIKFKNRIFGYKRKEFCYAGDWSFYLNLGTGDMTQCYCSYYSHNIFDDPSKPIPFHAIGSKCSEPHCYNGHSFLNFGDIPELFQESNYAMMRNRETSDGRKWLSPEFEYIFSHKLGESNQAYSAFGKLKTNLGIDLRCLKQKIVDKIHGNKG